MFFSRVLPQVFTFTNSFSDRFLPTPKRGFVSSVQCKTVAMCSGKPTCAPPHLSEPSLVLLLKQHLNDDDVLFLFLFLVGL